VKRVYLAADLADAQIAIDLLGMRGIRAHVFNRHATGGLGELAATQIWPEAWVEDDEDAGLAMQALKEIRSAEDAGSKLCPQCGEENPGNFLSCWHCGQALV
jgi:predicted RNA-binding Zn-ribbon protein involved in translation (DUF1610 family)